MNKTLFFVSVVALVVALITTGCAGAASPVPTAAPPAVQVTQPPAAPTAPEPTQPTAGEKIGGTVSVMAVWGGSELDSFMAMVKPFEERTGVKIEYEGTRDLDAVLTSRVQGGNPPDLAGLPGVGRLQELAKSGALVPLDDVLDMQALQAQYDQGWIDLGTYNGKLYGIFSKAAVKSLVWYNPKAFQAAGYEIPQTWDELLALTDKIRADGKTPWCIGLESGAATGWPGNDWIADTLLHTQGVEVYDQWVRHEIPWTDPAVKNAYLEWAKIIGNEENVFGGVQGMLSTNFGESPFPLFSDPPGCYLHHQANFITDFILQQFPDLKPGEDFNFFALPPVDPSGGNPLMTAGDLFGMFRDTPQARALIQYLTTAEAQSIWAGRGGFLSANKTVPPSAYPDQLTQQIADMLAKAAAVRFGAGDLLPGAVGDPFRQGTLEFVQDPTASTADAVLTKIEAAAKEAYK